MDLDGFEAATVPHMNALYDAALRLAGDQATAQDLTQETYLRARSFATFEPGSNARAWLLRIQYNLFCTQYRRGRRMPLVWLDEDEADPALDLPSPEPGPEEQTVRELDREAVRRAIAGEDFRMACAGRHQRPDLRRGGHRDGGAPRHHPVPAAGPAPPRGAAAARAWKGAGR